MAMFPTKQATQLSSHIILSPLWRFLYPLILLVSCGSALSASTCIMYQTRAWWLSRLSCGLRTAIACTIVASATLYAPTKIHQIPTYPAFGYLTVILVVPQCTLGDTLGSLWHVIYATLQVLPAAILSLKVMNPGDISYAQAAVAIAIFSFIVGLPKSSSLLTKRIAFVQIVIVYAGAVIHGKSTGVVMHPVHVAASTLLGAVASVLALLLPFPRLAYSEVKKECCQYAENASKRLDLLVKAFCAENRQAAADLLLQANSVSQAGSQLIQSIKRKQEGMSWERSMVRFMKPSAVKPGDRLQNLEIPLRGMEMAMNSESSPKRISQSVIDSVKNMEGQIGLKLEQVRFLMPIDATTAPETKVESPLNPVLNLASISPTEKDLPVIFLLFCMRLLQDDFPVCSKRCDLKGNDPNPAKGANEASSGVCKSLFHRLVTSAAGSLDLVFALKCSISLGLAVFLGLHYAKENAYWSGLTVAISFVTGRQPAFNVANSRAQGTAFGSVYGLLGCYILQNHKEYRFVLVLPWIFVISFLRRSRMFGEAWGISAAIGGLLILGRNNYRQPPNVFAITRITEAVIGLLCFILVEIILQPKRAFTLAKIQLSNSLQSLQECVENINLCTLEKQESDFAASPLRQKQQKLKSHVGELERLIEEAEIEPSFWFVPFNTSIYRKLLKYFSKTVDHLSFVACISETLLQISQRSESSTWTEFQIRVNDDLKLFSERLCSSLGVLDDAISMKTKSRDLEEQTDIEFGKPAKHAFSLSRDGRKHLDTAVNSLITQSVDSIRDIHSSEEDQKLQSHAALCLGALGFCLNSLLQEATKMEAEIKELVRLERIQQNLEDSTEPVNFQKS